MPPEVGRGSKIKILIADDIPEARETLKTILSLEPDMEVVGTAATGRECLAMDQALRPDVIIMDITMPDMDGIAATQELARTPPAAGIIMVSVQRDIEYMRRAMLAGARDFLSKPPPPDELYKSIRRIGYRPFVPAPLPPAPQQKRTHMIAVYSPLGGAGKTTVATNIATELMNENTRVLLIDGKMQFGHVGVFLNLKSTATILDLLNHVDELDMELVDRVLATHDSGLRVLLAPQRPEEAELVEPAKVRALLDKLSGAFDFIIIDLASNLSGVALEVFDLAECILLVATPTLPSVIDALAVIKVFDDLAYPESKVQLVINKVTPELERAKVTLAVSAIEGKLKRKAIGVIPMDERKVLFAVNRGTTLVAKDRSVSPAKEIIALAEALRSNLQLTAKKTTGRLTRA